MCGFFYALNKSNWPTTSRHLRGYGSKWDKIRREVLKRDKGLCRCDQCKGGDIRLLPATEVHHIISKAKGGTDDLSNLQAINKECHKRETMKDQGKTYKPRVEIGLDGWPKG